MTALRLESVAAAIGSRCDARRRDDLVRRVTTDSREVRPGDLFFAIAGERLDGHRFIAEALSGGAVACVCARAWAESTESEAGDTREALLVVDDTIQALGQLASHYRRQVMSPDTVVIAITGSNGKTTTKAMLDHVLGGRLPGRAAPRSFNNHLGVPLTLLSAEAEDRYLIVEIGSNAPGEVGALAAIAWPDVGVITSIGAAHLEGLGSLDGVAREKCALLEHVRPEGFAVVNVDSAELEPYLHRAACADLVKIGHGPGTDVRISDAKTDLRAVRFKLNGRVDVEVPLPGAHHAVNAAAVYAVASRMGVDTDNIVVRLRTFAPQDGRACPLDLGGITVIDDSYNANPVSMAAAVRTLADVGGARRVFVMGDMFELGEESDRLHAQTVRAALDAGIDLLISVGPALGGARRAFVAADSATEWLHCDDAGDVSAELSARLKEGDTVWVKGSRLMALEKVVADLKRIRSSAARGLEAANAPGTSPDAAQENATGHDVRAGKRNTGVRAG